MTCRCFEFQVHLLDVGLFKRWTSQRSLYYWLAHLQDAFPQQLREMGWKKRTMLIVKWWHLTVLKNKKYKYKWTRVWFVCFTCYADVRYTFAYLKKVEVDLFGVSVLLFMHRHKKVLHVHHHPQQPVNLIFWHILQVGHMISCKQALNKTYIRLSQSTN